MGFLLSISQSVHSDAVTEAVVGAALGVLGLRGAASRSTVGTHRRRAKGDERFVCFVKLTTPERSSLSAVGLHRALESALAAAELEDAQIQVLEEYADTEPSPS